VLQVRRIGLNGHNDGKPVFATIPDIPAAIMRASHSKIPVHAAMPRSSEENNHIIELLNVMKYPDFVATPASCVRIAD
jgi:hypothetical protein